MNFILIITVIVFIGVVAQMLTAWVRYDTAKVESEVGKPKVKYPCFLYRVFRVVCHFIIVSVVMLAILFAIGYINFLRG